MIKKLCRCGERVDELYSFFNKKTGYRITCCEKCAEENKLNNEKEYEKISYKKIKSESIEIKEDRVIVKTIINEELNKTPEPNAN